MRFYNPASVRGATKLRNTGKKMEKVENVSKICGAIGTILTVGKVIVDLMGKNK